MAQHFSNQPEVYTGACPQPWLPFLPKVARVPVTPKSSWPSASWVCALKLERQSEGSLWKFPPSARHKVFCRDCCCCCEVPAAMERCSGTQHRREGPDEKDERRRSKVQMEVENSPLCFSPPWRFPATRAEALATANLVAKFILTCRKPGFYYSCLLLKGWLNILLSLPHFSGSVSAKKETSGVCL